jgi:hypothetical protein
MLGERHQPIHPDDAQFLSRRRFWSKGFAAVTAIGLATEVGALTHITYQQTHNQEKVNAISKVHPRPSDATIVEANNAIEEQNTHHDLPDRKVVWAQEQLNLRQAHDEAIARELPNGTIPWAETDKIIGIGGAVAAMAGAVAWRIVRGDTEQELSRRELFRRDAAGSEGR